MQVTFDVNTTNTTQLQLSNSDRMRLIENAPWDYMFSNFVEIRANERTIMTVTSAAKARQEMDFVLGITSR